MLKVFFIALPLIFTNIIGYTSGEYLTWLGVGLIYTGAIASAIILDEAVKK